MKYQSFGWKLIQVSVLKSVWIWGGHVARYDWKIPVRPDLLPEPLDLKVIGWTRSILTLSVKWVDLIYWISIERPRIRGRGAHQLELGFRWAKSGEAHWRWTPAMLPEVTDGDGGQDDVQSGLGMTLVWTAASGVASCGVCTRTESLQATVIFGR
jgi:hypothetical protein